MKVHYLSGEFLQKIIMGVTKNIWPFGQRSFKHKKDPQTKWFESIEVLKKNLPFQFYIIYY